MIGWLLEHFVDVFIGLSFLIFGWFLYKGYGLQKLTTDTDLLMVFVVSIGLFLTWLQFLSSKHTKRKEAALTYYPRPMELEKVENDIDMVIRFWSSNYTMQSYEVKLMLDQEITPDEYRLCWTNISEEIKRDIFDTYDKYYSTGDVETSEQPEVLNAEPVSRSTIEYREEYNTLIREKFVGIRRKLNLYLNQIEGFCLAINNGSIHSESAKRIYIHKLTNHYRKAKPYIDELRIAKNSNELFIEFERVVDRWKNK